MDETVVRLRPRVMNYLLRNSLDVSEKDKVVYNFIDKMFEDREIEIENAKKIISDGSKLTISAVCNELRAQGFEGCTRDNLSHHKREMIRFIKELKASSRENKVDEGLESYRKKQIDINVLNIQILQLKSQIEELQRRIDYYKKLCEQKESGKVLVFPK